MRPSCLRLLLASIVWLGPATAQEPARLPASSEGLPPHERGLLWLGELGCVRCHETPHEATFLPRIAPNLQRVRSRLRPAAIAAMIERPSEAKPGTTMPSVLGHLPVEQRTSTARAITAYLLSLDEAPLDTRPPATPNPQAGRELFHGIGCVACHAPRDENARELDVPGSLPLGALENRYTHASLVAFLEAPERVRPSGRMPNFALQPAESHALASYLVQGEGESIEDFDSRADDVARGRRAFDELGCASCHETGEPHASRTTPPLDRLDGTKGCLSDEHGAWPRFALTDAGRNEIRVALAALERAPREEARVRFELARFNCLACHVRGELGGVARERDAFFQGADANLGEPGRIPPPLTGVGAKLQRTWLHDAIASGQKIRPYVFTRMPGFGDDVAERLTALFVARDHLERSPIEDLSRNREQANETREMGRMLVGEDGMNCIACHTFREGGGEAMPGIDLVDSTTRRLTRDWFYHYMLEPARFQPGTVMPMYFLDGVSVRDEVAEGDPVKQLTALWHYMENGRNAREPRGLRRLPIELEVANEAVMLRRSVQDTGKRGISIGYPGGVNATFDAETIALNQIWWGRFIDAVPVWTGQGSGQAHILERERLTLPKGPALIPLPRIDEPWPAATRRELGHTFLGYTLDALRRPTFAYGLGAVTVRDEPRNVDEGGQIVLRRTITLTGPRPTPYVFRAAMAPRIEIEAGVAHIGDRFVIRFGETKAHLIERGDDRELRFEIPKGEGEAQLVLTYARRGDGR